MTSKDLLKQYKEQTENDEMTANSICCCGLDDCCSDCCDPCGCEYFCMGARGGCMMGLCDCCTDC